MQETILAISGKPGLYKLIARGNASLIVEAIDETHRRQPAGARDRVTSLGDVTMYTEADDVPLMLVFQTSAMPFKAVKLPSTISKPASKSSKSSWTKRHFPHGIVSGSA